MPRNEAEENCFCCFFNFNIWGVYWWNPASKVWIINWQNIINLPYSEIKGFGFCNRLCVVYIETLSHWSKYNNNSNNFNKRKQWLYMPYMQVQQHSCHQEKISLRLLLSLKTDCCPAFTLNFSLWIWRSIKDLIHLTYSDNMSSSTSSL